MVDEKFKKLAEKRFKDGWLRSWMMIEVLGSSEKVADESLNKHIQKMEKEKNTMVYKKTFKGIKKIDNPTPNIKVGYSNVVEIEVLTKNLETLVFIVMSYGPSATEIIEPENIRLDIGEAQAVLNSVADMMHKFAAAGVGGVIINS